MLITHRMCDARHVTMQIRTYWPYWMLTSLAPGG
jgi:hypothetical protein